MLDKITWQLWQMGPVQSVGEWKRHLHSKEQAQTEIGATVHYLYFLLWWCGLGHQHNPTFWSLGPWSYLSLALLLVGAGIFTHTNMPGAGGGNVFECEIIGFKEWFFFFPLRHQWKWLLWSKTWKANMLHLMFSVKSGQWNWVCSVNTTKDQQKAASLYRTKL